MSPRPEKWYYSNSYLSPGKNYYSYRVPDVLEGRRITDRMEDDFYVECMECIKIDIGDWDKKEVCSDCIFSEFCVKERRIK